MAWCTWHRLTIAALTFALWCDAAHSEQLENLEFVGTTRLSTDFIANELNLKPGTVLDDEFVIATKQRLLSLGIFRSVLLYQKRGSKPGMANLVIEVDDDPSILTDYGIGGLMGVTYEQQDAKNTSTESAPLGYKVQLLARNLFNELHRGLLMADIDSVGQLRQARLTYGLPRFTVEDVQFDIDLAATDVTRRYLDANGFGGRAQSLWTKSYGKYDLQYGPAMYVNRKPRFAVPGFPTSTAGPKLSFIRETRLNRFLPGEGYLVNAGLLYSVITAQQSNLELRGAYTIDILDLTFLTFDAKVLTVGAKGYSARGDVIFDIPVGPSKSKPVDIYAKFRAGKDEYKDTHLHGSAAIFGLRYHSSGFIADLSLQVTTKPKQLLDGEQD